jgi:Spy/CpxP family protein refolding chaperone
MKSMVRLIGTLGVLTLGVVAMPPVANADPAQTENVESTAQAMHHGARQLFERAIEDARLRPKQQAAVDELIADAEHRHEPTKAAKRELMLAVADQIEAGKIDRCALAPQIEALANAMAEAHPGDRAALEKLHSILDPEQRVRFVDSLQKGWASAKKSHTPRLFADYIAKKLGLSDEQKDRVEDILSGIKEVRDADPDHAEHHRRWARILEAFKGNDFDIDEVAPMGDVKAKRTKHIEGHLWAAEAMLPVLNDEQRALLAKKLRDKATGHTTTGATREVESMEED